MQPDNERVFARIGSYSVGSVARAGKRYVFAVSRISHGIFIPRGGLRNDSVFRGKSIREFIAVKILFASDRKRFAVVYFKRHFVIARPIISAAFHIVNERACDAKVYFRLDCDELCCAGRFVSFFVARINVGYSALSRTVAAAPSVRNGSSERKRILRKPARFIRKFYYDFRNGGSPFVTVNVHIRRLCRSDSRSHVRLFFLFFGATVKGKRARCGDNRKQ